MMKKSLLLFSVLFLAVSVAQSQRIMIVTDAPDLEEPGAGNLGDFLRELGYAVTVDPGIEAIGDPGDNDSSFHGVLTDDEIALLESHDLVIFHRATNSGDFDDLAEQWNELNVPLWNGSAFTARNDPNRWNWVNGSQSGEESEFIEAIEPDHPLFTNVNIVDGFVRIWDVPQEYNSLDTGSDAGNGIVVAETEFNLLTAIAVWDEPGLFHPDRPEFHNERRIYFSLSRYFEDDGSGALAFEHYSEDGLQLLRNAAEYAIFGDVQGRTPTGGGTSVSSWSLF